jgi:hypothetical protein
MLKKEFTSSRYNLINLGAGDVSFNLLERCPSIYIGAFWFRLSYDEEMSWAVQ